MLSIAGAALIVLALVLHAAENVALRRQAKRRAELIRLRLQDEPSSQRMAYRKIQIRLGGD